MTNLWHDISRGENAPEELNVIIEIPKGSSNKYEVDKETGLIALDRANYSSAPYPFDYGFVPQTLWEDNDPLDVVVLTTFPLSPGILARVRPVAFMDMVDGEDSDVKIIAVPVDDKRWENVHDIDDLNQHTLKEFAHFFETYKSLKNDTADNGGVIIKGSSGRKDALAAIEKSISLYTDKYSS